MKHNILPAPTACVTGRTVGALVPDVAMKYIYCCSVHLSLISFIRFCAVLKCKHSLHVILCVTKNKPELSFIYALHVKNILNVHFDMRMNAI